MTEHKKTDEIVFGKSESTLNLLQVVNRVATTDSAVLIYGESGVGKRKVAEKIHQLSHRADKAFVTINCASLTNNWLQSEFFGFVVEEISSQTNSQISFRPNLGTLFLDEIGDLTLGMQARLLKILEDENIRLAENNKTYPVCPRIISATHKNLQDLMDKKEFREDLFYRIQGMTVTVDPLRHRKEDIFDLIHEFEKCASQKYDVSEKHFDPMVIQKLMEYDWPGNVRELKTVVTNLVLLAEGSLVTLKDFESYSQIKKSNFQKSYDELALKEVTRSLENGELSLSDAKKAFEKIQILKALKKSDGNITTASQHLQMPRPQVSRLVKKYQLKDLL